MTHDNRIDNEQNNLGLWEQEQLDRARELARQFGERAIDGRVPVRIDKRTVIFKKKEKRRMAHCFQVAEPGI